MAAFREMYLAESIIFKQQKLIHYPRIFKSSGPFLYQSVLKYERKHIFIKHIADSTNNFKNIYQTIAVRYQLNQFLDWRDSVPRKSERFPNRKVVTVTDELALCFYPEVFPNNEVFESRSVFIQGTRYSVDDVLFLTLQNAHLLTPNFCQIKRILSSNDSIFFCFLQTQIRTL